MTDALLTFDGITQPINDWALDYGIYPAVIAERLEHGWTAERAITTPMAIAPRQRLEANHLPGLPELTRKRRRCTKPVRRMRKNNRGAKSRHYIEHDGERLSVSQWSERVGISATTLRRRFKDGWPIHLVLSSERMSGQGRVVRDFAPISGTGGGRHAQDISELEFSE